MRRAEREITDMEELLAVLDLCNVCRIGLQDDEGMYIVPVNFGYSYQNGQVSLFFHSALDGRKTRALGEQKPVAFEMDCEHELVRGDIPCQYSFAYKSIIGQGNAIKLTDATDRKVALEVLMKHVTGEKHMLTELMTGAVNVYKIEVKKMTGKHRPHPMAATAK